MKILLRAVAAAPLLLLVPAACGSGNSNGTAGSADSGGAPGTEAGWDAAAAGDAGHAGDGGIHPSDAGSADHAAPPEAGLDAAKDAAADAPACVPSCGGAVCGDNGCGGSCGSCSAPAWCGGGGTPGQCGSGSTIPQYPGVTPTQVDHGPALGLRVAGDEKHVLVQRTETTTGPNAFLQGGIAVVTVDSAGAGSAVELTTEARFMNGQPEADFTTDSQGLYFVDVSSTTAQLVAAAADGTGAHVLASGGIERVQGAGSTVVYTLDAPDGSGNREVWAAALPSGTPVRLVAAGALYYPLAAPSPTGTSVLLMDQSLSHYELAHSATGAVTALAVNGLDITGWAWSPDGARFAYWVAQSGGSTRALHVVNADGSADTVLTTSNLFDPAFLPDGQSIAYDVAGASGTAIAGVTVRGLGAGGSTAVVTAGATHPWNQLAVSPDGGLLLLTSSDNALAVAPSAHNGAFADFATGLSTLQGSPPPLTLCAVTPAHDLLAALLANRAASVLPTGGGAGHVLSVPVDDLPFYEPVATAPRLLAFTSTSVSQSGIAGSVALFATDGSGAATTLPGAVLPAFTLAQLWHSAPFGWTGVDSGSGQVAEPFPWGWFGSEIVYETDRGQNGTTAFDVVAATDDAGTVGVIAPGAAVWSVRGAATPTRAYFPHPSSDGVWWSPMPQTPGR
jgi:hypothetical protein